MESWRGGRGLGLWVPPPAQRAVVREVNKAPFIPLFPTPLGFSRLPSPPGRAHSGRATPARKGVSGVPEGGVGWDSLPLAPPPRPHTLWLPNSCKPEQPGCGWCSSSPPNLGCFHVESVSPGLVTSAHMLGVGVGTNRGLQPSCGALPTPSQQRGCLGVGLTYGVGVWGPQASARALGGRGEQLGLECM